MCIYITFIYPMPFEWLVLIWCSNTVQSFNACKHIITMRCNQRFLKVCPKKSAGSPRQVVFLMHLWAAFSKAVSFLSLCGSLVPLTQRWDFAKMTTKVGKRACTRLKWSSFHFNVITGDESWISGLASETKQCKHPFRSLSRSMLLVFFHSWLFHCEFVAQDQSVNTDSYRIILRCPKKIIHCHYSHQHNHRSPPTLHDKRLCSFLQS